jgi:hypothetical protein
VVGQQGLLVLSFTLAVSLSLLKYFYFEVLYPFIRKKKEEGLVLALAL